MKAVVRGQIADESRGRLSDTQYAYRHDKNLATFDRIGAYVSTGRSDYSLYENDEDRYGLVDHPYDTITVHDEDKSRGHLGSSLNKISDISRNQEVNHRECIAGELRLCIFIARIV